jgi:hypothetical protein
VPPAQDPSFVTIGCQKTVLLRNIQYYCSNVQPRTAVTNTGKARDNNNDPSDGMDSTEDNNVEIPMDRDPVEEVVKDTTSHPDGMEEDNVDDETTDK